jgi:hypothetical protein
MDQDPKTEKQTDQNAIIQNQKIKADQRHRCNRRNRSI